MGKRINLYEALTRGAEDGLTVLLHIIPALVGLLTAVSMFRASGAMDLLTSLCAPLLERLGIPPETAPLMLIRPVSGSGALAVASDLMAAHGPDSYIGRVAAVMMGSTETTFYTIAVYFGAAGIVRTPTHGTGRSGGRPHWVFGRCSDRPAFFRYLNRPASSVSSRKSAPFSNKRMVRCRFYVMRSRNRSRLPSISVT